MGDAGGRGGRFAGLVRHSPAASLEWCEAILRCFRVRTQRLRDGGIPPGALDGGPVSAHAPRPSEYRLFHLAGRVNNDEYGPASQRLSRVGVLCLSESRALSFVNSTLINNQP